MTHDAAQLILRCILSTGSLITPQFTLDTALLNIIRSDYDRANVTFKGRLDIAGFRLHHQHFLTSLLCLYVVLYSQHSAASSTMNTLELERLESTPLARQTTHPADPSASDSSVTSSSTAPLYVSVGTTPLPNT